MKLFITLLLLIALVMVGSTYAGETRCAAVYLEFMEEIRTAEKVKGDPCLEADAYERCRFSE